MGPWEGEKKTQGKEKGSGKKKETVKYCVSVERERSDKAWSTHRSSWLDG